MIPSSLIRQRDMKARNLSVEIPGFIASSVTVTESSQNVLCGQVAFTKTHTVAGRNERIEIDQQLEDLVRTLVRVTTKLSYSSSARQASKTAKF